MTDELLRRVSEARIAKSAAAVELWSSRLDLLIQVGDLRGMLDHLRAPVESGGNNCECNNACNVPCGSACGSFVLREQSID